jgi:hypothetical protein
VVELDVAKLLMPIKNIPLDLLIVQYTIQIIISIIIMAIKKYIAIAAINCFFFIYILIYIFFKKNINYI